MGFSLRRTFKKAFKPVQNVLRVAKNNLPIVGAAVGGLMGGLPGALIGGMAGSARDQYKANKEMKRANAANEAAQNEQLSIVRQEQEAQAREVSQREKQLRDEQERLQREESDNQRTRRRRGRRSLLAGAETGVGSPSLRPTLG